MPPKFVPRQRKHKVLARERAKENSQHEVGDTNQEIIVTDKQAQAEKRARLREELKKDGDKMSSKKAKRLEKYIDTKLKKDENRELLAKLAARKIDTSLFSSSKALGQGRQTKKEALARAYREHKAGIDGDEENNDVLFQKLREVDQMDEDEDESDDDVPDAKPESIKSTKPEGVTPAAEPKPVATETPAPAVGSGLKRPLELNEDGKPILKKRQKRGGVKSKISLAPVAPVPESDEGSDDDADSWNGFDSEDGGKEGSQNGEDNDESETSDDESEDDDEDSDDEDSEAKSARSSAFKAWATQQRNEALGYKTADGAILDIPTLENFVPRAPEQDPLPRELQATEAVNRKVHAVALTRTEAITEARMKLPVVAMEQRIMEDIHNHDIVVICGATGSGKTTQVPQFLYEAGYGSPDSDTPGMIGVTQPRRVAAVSMSKRIAEELGDHGYASGYQIRFEGTVDAKTAIKFMTDGVLLREIAQDITLKKYSAIIIDEAHERSVNTDILIGMLSRIVRLRSDMAKDDKALKPLKLIIMSATLRIEDMTMNPNLFPTPPPVVDVAGRQHPVTIHFSRRTNVDYVEEAFKKISRGHRKLPPGGFLVFLTGRNEILQLSKRLKASFGGPRTAESHKVQISAADGPMEVEDLELGNMDGIADEDIDDGILEEEEGEDEDEFDIEEDQEMAPLKMQVLPLYSLLPTREQMRVFEPVPEGTRQVILATNVAETSLTIPGTRFVFDCGRSKERQYDRQSGVQSYDIGWISKASASQRSGRAGRTGPGHCYRLYSSAVFERDFAEFADPELLRMPIEGVVLQLKAMNLQHVVNFPFPTPPDRTSLAMAEKLLTYLSAIDSEGQVTRVGKTMSVFPLAPRFARILLVGHSHGCLPYAIALVAGLSAAEVFLPEAQAIPALTAKEDVDFRTTADVIAEDRQANVRRLYNQVQHNFCFLDDKSDAIKLLQVVGEFAHEPTEDWCDRHFVRFKVLKEIQQLRKQITELLRANIPAFAALKHQDKLDPPSPTQVKALKQMVSAGFVDRIAKRADLMPTGTGNIRKPTRPIDVPYVPLIPVETRPHQVEESFVYIHPTSPLAHTSVQECPKYIVYSYLQRTSSAGIESEKKGKTRMHALTDVGEEILASLAKGTPLLSYGKPKKIVKVSDDGLSRQCLFEPSLRAEGTGGMGWPLPHKILKEKKVAGKGWVLAE